MKNLSIAILVIAIFGVLALNGKSIVSAASPYFLRINSTATATTTVTYMSPGTATTTLVSDIYQAEGYADVQGKMSIAIGIQLTASSTNTTLKIRPEYCYLNCLTSGDWYSATNELAISATTTPLTGNAKEYSLTFASSTLATETIQRNRLSTIVEVPVLMRYVRLTFYLPAGSTNGAVWAESIGVKNRTY